MSISDKRRCIIVVGALVSLVAPCATADPGVTVITHGFQIFTNEKAPWVLALGEAIAARAGGGTVYRYQPDTGHWALHSGDGNVQQETILLFNWSEESDSISAGTEWGFAEAAGDALYAALRDPQGLPEELDWETLRQRRFHFIAHSRGASVFSETIERLGARVNLAVDQFTAVDPHPVNGTFPEPCNVYPNWGDPLPRRWSNVAWADVYHRQDNNPLSCTILCQKIVAECLCDFDGLELSGFHSVPLSIGDLLVIDECLAPCTLEHVKAHAWYSGTVNTTTGHECPIGCCPIDDSWYPDGRDTVGYFFSDVVGHPGQERPRLPGTAPEPVFGEVLYNGGFTLGSQAGWKFHGGDPSGSGADDIVSGGPTGHYLRLNADKHSRAHNRFILEDGFGRLSLSFRVIADAVDESLRIRLDPVEPGQSFTATIPLSDTTADWIFGHSINIPPTVERGKAYTLTLEIVNVTGGIDAEVGIDNLVILGPTIGCVTLDITPSQVPVDGTSVATLIATVTDDDGTPLPNVPVTFSRQTLCTGAFRDCDTDQVLPDPHTVITDVEGRAQTCYRALIAETCSFSAETSKCTATASVDFIAPQTCMTLVVDPASTDPCRYELKAELYVCDMPSEDVDFGKLRFSVADSSAYFLDSNGLMVPTVCEEVSSTGLATVDMYLSQSVTSLEVQVCFIPKDDLPCDEARCVAHFVDVRTYNCAVECQVADRSLSEPAGEFLRIIASGEHHRFLAAVKSAAGAQNGRGAVVWDMDSWAVMQRFDDPEERWSDTSNFADSFVTYALDVPTIIAGNPSRWAILDVPSGDVVVHENLGSFDPTDASVTPDGSRLWLLDDGSTSLVGWYNVALRTHVLVESLVGDVTAIAVSPDGSRVAYTVAYTQPSPDEPRLRILNAVTGALVAESPTDFDGVGNGVAWSPDSQTVVCDSHQLLEFFTRDGVPLGDEFDVVIPGEAGAIEWSPDGQYIAAHVDDDASSPGVWILAWPSGLAVARLCGFQGFAENQDTIAWRHDSKVIAVSHRDTTAVDVFAPFDSTSPHLDVDMPPEGLVVSSDTDTITVSGVVSEDDPQDAGVPRNALGEAIAWTFDGDPGSTEEAQADGSYSFPVPIPFGQHTVCLQATDIAGNLSAEICRSIRRLTPPQLQVTINGSLVSDGQVIPMPPAKQGQAPQCLHFEIVNLGEEALTINCPRPDDHFRVAACPPPSLEPGMKAEYVLCMNTDDCGDFTAELAFETNQPRPIFAFAVNGSVEGQGDLNGDGMVDPVDLMILIDSMVQWGACPNPCPPYCLGDIDGDCAVGTSDLLILLAEWGVACD